MPRKLPLNSLIPKKVVDVKGAITIDAVVLLNFERECGKRKSQRLGRTNLSLYGLYVTSYPNTVGKWQISSG
jgi:hypothetical protein